MTDCEKNSHHNPAASCRGRRSRQHQRGRRKERVLHTRVSEQLSDDIRRLADELRVPVSNLVRNVLEEVFTVVESVSEEVGDFFEDVVEEAGGVRERIRNQQRAARGARRAARRSRPGGRSGPAEVETEFRRDEAAEAREAGRRSNPNAAAESRDNVLGWQSIVLNQATHCADCRSWLEPGAKACMAISRDGELGKVVCPGCGAPS